MLKGLTNRFKKNCNKISLTYKEYVILNGVTIPIKAELDDDCYENGNFIGTFIFKSLKFETDATYNFKNKEFEYYKSVNGESIKIGTFITTELEINDTTNIVKVVAMDYGLKTQIEYKSSLDYESGEITLLDVWNEACTLSGLESGVQSFPNSDFIVDSDQFSGTGAMIRDVYKGIALSSGTFIKVMNDDKIYPIFKQTTNDIIEDYVELEDKRDTQPWTCLRLGVSQIDGENLDYIDEELVQQYGEHWLILNDNPFAYNQEKRQQLIMGIFNQIKAFGYSAFVSKTSFKPYFTCGDLIQFRNREGNLVNSIILRYNHDAEEITLEAPSETSATINYIFPLNAVTIAKNTQIEVDKQQNQINTIAESTQDITDYIKTIEGDNEITLTNTMLSNGAINYVEITGFTPLNLYPDMTYPGENVYPNEMTTYTIITQNDNNYNETYIDLGTQLILTDKLILEPNKITIIRANETIYQEKNNVFETFDDTTKISVKYLDNVHLKCQYIIKNDFTKQFATQAQLSSNFTITDEKITSKVSKAEIISEINQSAEEVQIDANKISLEGKEINLTGDNIDINSDNFKVDKYGNLLCNNATISNANITGGLIKLSGDSSNPKFIIVNTEDDSKYMQILPSTIRFFKSGLIPIQLNSLLSTPIITLINSSNDSYTSQLTSDYITLTNGSATTRITSTSVTPGSLAKSKQNFELFKNGIDTIKQIDIYSYNYKNENSNKKHIGFVIGDKYKYSSKVTSDDNTGVDLYSFVSVCCQAIKEQQEIIEKLQKEVQKLKEVR